MTNNLVSAIKALMEKYSITSMVEQLTIVQAIDSNNDQIQENAAEIAALEANQPLYVYKAIVNQSGTNAPTATILINTFPDATFAYLGAGEYTLDLGLSVNQFGTTTIQQTCYNGTTAFNVVGSPSLVYEINTYNSSRVAADDLLVDYTLIIEAYPIA